jgi:FAD synthetase
MVRVLATGVFDILHTGHLHYLREAKAMGDELCVVVACDNTVRRRKHEPITPDKMRAELVNALKPVDRAMVGEDGDRYRIVLELHPDIIALGYDQDFDEGILEKDLRDRGLCVKVKRVSQCSEDLTGTRKIIQKVIDNFERAEKTGET